MEFTKKHAVLLPAHLSVPIDQDVVTLFSSTFVFILLFYAPGLSFTQYNIALLSFSLFALSNIIIIVLPYVRLWYTLGPSALSYATSVKFNLQKLNGLSVSSLSATAW